MRSKALLIGAHPPFVGPWVSVKGLKNPRTNIVTHPAGVELNGQLKLESGNEGMMRASIEKVDGLSSVSVYLEDGDDGTHNAG